MSEVKTEFGKVRGIEMVSALDQRFIAFLGIPYATPPLGDLRFKDPQPPAPWEGVYDATEEKPGCYEINSISKQIIGSEDCLTLNIFTKNLRPDKLQPVMVHVYGGQFRSGSNSLKKYSPDFLLMADVVVVLMNYRFGAFGFLNLKDESLSVPGNAGLKDQRMALKFVKRNIRTFGGDPENICLMGHSSGARSVSWHSVSEGSKGLFKRAIVMSGCVLDSFSLVPYRDWANRLARKLGYEGSEEEKEILEYLREADPVKIVEHQSSLIGKDEKNIELSFAPCVEHYWSDEAFILKEPIEMMRNAWSNDIDIMIGGTSDEGFVNLLSTKNNPELLVNFDLNSVVPQEVIASPDDPRVVYFIECLKRVYFSPCYDLTLEESVYCKILGDQQLWHGLHRTVRARQSYGRPGKTFLYRFAVDSPTQNFYRNRYMGPNSKGAVHADDLCYLFKSDYGPVPGRDTIEFKTIQRYVSLFTSFATDGNPNGNVINADMQGIVMKPVDTLEPPFNCLNIDVKLEFKPFPDSDRLETWDRLFEDTNTPMY